MIIWGLANFAVTLLTPIGFNNLKTGYSSFLRPRTLSRGGGLGDTPETGGRSFEVNQEFFETAKEEGTWIVAKVDGGNISGCQRRGMEMRKSLYWGHPGRAFVILKP